MLLVLPLPTVARTASARRKTGDSRAHAHFAASGQGKAWGDFSPAAGEQHAWIGQASTHAMARNDCESAELAETLC